MDNLFVIEKNVENWSEAIRACTEVLQKNGNVDEEFCQACIEREKEYPTGLAASVGVAIPHTQKSHVFHNGVCFLRLPKPVAFRRMDDPDDFVDASFVFNLAINNPEQQLSTLSKVMSFIQDDKLLKRCQTMSLDELRQTIRTFLS